MTSSTAFMDNAASTLRAESVPAFRMAQLLLVLDGVQPPLNRVDLERLSIIEFLSANPFLVVGDDSP